MKGFHSPYYNESHKRFRLATRKFIAEKIKPFSDDWEENGTYPTKDLYL